MKIVDLALDDLLKNLYEKIISLGKEQAGLVLSLDDEVRFLRRTALPKVTKVVVNAERPEDEEWREFLAGLRDFAYDAEDILDELDTEVGRTKQQQPQPQQTEHGRKARQLMDWVKVVMDEQWFKGLCIILKSVCRCFPVFSSFDSDDYDQLPLLFRTKIANQIKGLYAELGKVVKDKDRVKAFANSLKGVISGDGEEATDSTASGSSSSWKRPRTDAMLRKDFRLVGRDGVKDRVVKGLLASRSDPSPSVLLIMGMGGIGKTTLAQDIFPDPAVVKHFEFRMWLCVGDMELDPKKVLDKISGKPTNDLEGAREKAQSAVKDKRFLIVLDDVWKGNKLRSSWNELWDPLSYGDRGSRVIVTTRQGDILDEVAAVVAVAKEELHPLADEACLEIFETFAFQNVRGTPSPRLKEIGKRIVCEKIKGVPLAARVIGSSLRRHQRVGPWKSALHEINEKDISSALIWSYRCLPTHLKQCFSYCSLFPKDSCLDRTEVVRMWMAQCYVIQSKGSRMTLEDVGEEYFDELVRASLIQVVCDDYKMHDLIHDLAMEVSRGVCFYKSEEGDKTEHYEAKEPQALRHLVLDRGVKLPQNHSNIKKLRTFKSYDPCHADILSNQLWTVRVLIVTKRIIANYEANFTNMMHLRYLDLSGLGIRTLPESLCNLYNLQVLALSNKVTEFPPGMCKLIHLRHLHGGDHISRITGIGELTSLQTISDFYSTIGEFYSLGNEGESLRELKNLNQLRGRLTICNLKSVQSSQFAHDAQLHNKIHLEELVLNTVDTDFHRCVDDVGETSLDRDRYMMLIREVFGGLRPHEDIKVLKIKNYPADELPTWMEGHTILNIVSLSLRSCDHLKKLPPLGHLRYLEFLKIKYSSSIKGIGCEIYGTSMEQVGCEGPEQLQVFFCLKELVLMGIPKLKEWEELVVPGDEGQIDYFPSLRRLYVKECKNLRRLPHVPASLEELYIDSTALTVLPKVWGCSCDDAGDVSVHNCSPRCLTSLSLIDCAISVVNHWLSHMPSLSTVILHRVNKCAHVAIESCDNLVKLEMLGMDELKSLKLQNLGSLELFSLLECPSLLEIGLANLPSLCKMEILDCRVTKISGLRDLRALRRMLMGFYDAITINVADEYALKNLDSLEAYYTWGILKAVDPKSLVILRLSNFNFSRDMSSNDQEWLSQWWQNLESIEEIIIFGASGHSFPPFMRLQNLHSLKRVEISYCYKLQVLPKLPPHFRRERLIIEECQFLQDIATDVQVLSS